jgi:hypothetical protein
MMNCWMVPLRIVVQLPLVKAVEKALEFVVFIL